MVPVGVCVVFPLIGQYCPLSGLPFLLASCNEPFCLSTPVPHSGPATLVSFPFLEVTRPSPSCSFPCCPLKLWHALSAHGLPFGSLYVISAKRPGDQPFLSFFTESAEEGLPFLSLCSVSSEACALGSQGTSALFLLTPGAHRCAQLVFDVTS